MSFVLISYCPIRQTETHSFSCSDDRVDGTWEAALMEKTTHRTALFRVHQALKKGVCKTLCLIGPECIDDNNT